MSLFVDNRRSVGRAKTGLKNGAPGPPFPLGPGAFRSVKSLPSVMGRAHVTPGSLLVGGSDLVERGSRAGVIFLPRFGSGPDQNGSVVPQGRRGIGMILLRARGGDALGLIQFD